MNQRIHLVIEGRVQGVGFRYYCVDVARELHLTGWVRNMPGGRTVEAVAEGEPEALDRFLDWCRRGPSLAFVKNVEATRSEAAGEFDSFQIIF